MRANAAGKCMMLSGAKLDSLWPFDSPPRAAAWVALSFPRAGLRGQAPTTTVIRFRVSTTSATSEFRSI